MERREFIAAMIAAPVATTIAAGAPPAPALGPWEFYRPSLRLSDKELSEALSAAYDRHDFQPPNSKALNQAINDLYRKMKAQA